MRENNVRTIAQAGGAVVNGWLGIPSSFAAEVMAHAGFDSLTIDMQHGAMHYDVALPMLQAISTTGVTPLTRVPWNEPGIIGKVLDAGSYGIICPMINNREETERLVRACKYPPVGSRSNGPTRARYYGGADYATAANDTVLAMAMVETAEAMKNLDDILSTPGLDGIYVGPADLSISLKNSMPPDPMGEQAMTAIKQVAEACKRHGIIAGIHCMSNQHALDMIGLGYQFVTLQSDTAFLASQAAASVAAVRGGDAKASPKMY
ncbi:MAG: aldolase/citrate lyase family protein [Caldilineaceae bacterium]